MRGSARIDGLRAENAELKTRLEALGADCQALLSPRPNRPTFRKPRRKTLTPWQQERRGGSLRLGHRAAATSVDPDVVRTWNPVDRQLRSLVHRRRRDLRIPSHAAVLDRVPRFLLAASGEVAFFQLMDDDLVLRATEIVRRLLADLPAGEASAHEKCQHTNDYCGFHDFVLDHRCC